MVNHFFSQFDWHDRCSTVNGSFAERKGDTAMTNSTANQSKEAYLLFGKSAQSEGALDVKTKKLLHLAVVLALNCEP